MDTPAASSPPPPSRSRGAARLQTVEEQRATLYKQLISDVNASPEQQNQIKQALLRLSSPQNIKLAAAQGIFVSYARSDELFAIQLTEDLRQAGLPAWLDATDIPDDADWHAEVEAALKRCGLMVLIVSSDAQEDEAQHAELQRFMDSGKIVIPVIYERLQGITLNLPIQPVDFRHDYTLGLNILTRLLASTPVTSTRQ